MPYYNMEKDTYTGSHDILPSFKENLKAEQNKTNCDDHIKSNCRTKN